MERDLTDVVATHYTTMVELVGENLATQLTIDYHRGLLKANPGREEFNSSKKPAGNAANDLSGVIARLDAIERVLDQLSDPKPESVTDEERQQHELEIAGRDLAIRNLAAELRKSISAEDIQRVMARSPEPGRKAAWRV
jgi:hypothetical protein